MLGSAHAGECAAAALKASEFIKDRGHTWKSLVTRAFASRTRDEKPRHRQHQPHWTEAPRTDAEWCAALQERCAAFLSEWEVRFLHDVLKRGRWPLSDKQRIVIDKMRKYIYIL
jgi:hypothetical protein